MANDLRIQEVRLAGFRNYRSLALGNVGGLTIFVGPNATAKAMSSREFNFCAPMGRFVRPAAATSLCGARHSLASKRDSYPTRAT